MEIGTILHHFEILNVREQPEIHARLWEMRYEKTGTPLFWLDRQDENKAFAIAFRTIPQDSTGVFHILEHSVLNGSDRYPVKEPFVELLKCSVQTFLNAMTYPDKTVYPVSSRSDQDLLNLIQVYMDAVLHPAIYHKPEIFLQEGWRYDLREDGSIGYQGVVFNEMKGAYGSADAVLEYEIQKRLFPDICYRHESGGHPEHIMDLTYEQFLENHRTFYHPSNACIALSGSVDLDAVLALLDQYLTDYTQREAAFSIPLQQPVCSAPVEVPYEIGVEEDPAEKTIISCGQLLGTYDDVTANHTAAILASYLAGDNEAPLKRAVLDAGLGQDVQINIHGDFQQPWVTWEVWNTDREKLEQIQQVMEKTLTDLADNGLDRERLEACYNRLAFRARDWDNTGAPRSLAEVLIMVDPWIYGGDPAMHLQEEDTLNDLAAKLDTDYYASFLRRLFLENDHRALVVLTPSQTLGEEKRKKEADRAAAESACWTNSQRQQLRAQLDSMTCWQQAEDTPEALATIPMLQLEDLKPAPEDIPVSVTTLGEIPLLRHCTGNELVYLNLHFAASDLTEEDLPYLSLLTTLLGKLPTAAHTSAQLQNRIKQKTGKLRIGPNVFRGSDTEHCQLWVSASLVCLAAQSDSAFALISEILTETLFHDRNLLQKILNQLSMDMQLQLSSWGNRFAVTRCSAYLTAHGAATEYLSGCTFAAWLKEASNAGEDRLDEIMRRMEQLFRQIFTANRLTIGASETADTDLLSALTASLPKSNALLPREAAYAPLNARQEGMVIPAAVGFAAKASSLRKHGEQEHGSLYVLSNILSYGYLWNEIRVQGGAYGTGFGSRSGGDLFFYTFRDPQPGRSLDCFDRAGDYIRSFCADDPDLTKFILGAVSDLDPLLNTESKIATAEARYLRGVTYEYVCRLYRELLHTSGQDLLDRCPALDRLAQENAVCVIAGQAQLDACGQKLKTIHNI